MASRGSFTSSPKSGISDGRHYAGAVATYLDTILTAHRRAAESDVRDLAALRTLAAGVGAPRDFAAALSGPVISVIAEIKRRSPSKGDLDVSLDAASLGGLYEASGASALSVLTDSEFFGGSWADLEAAWDAVKIPVLRKDFTVSERDIYDARIHGADAVLLIVAALSDLELSRFHDVARDLGLAVLVEVHDDEELDRALGVGASIVGVNQRDLRTFAVDQERAARLIEGFPPDVLAVAESGVRDGADAEALALAGFDAVLVGESLITSPDRTGALRALTGHAVAPRRVARR